MLIKTKLILCVIFSILAMTILLSMVNIEIRRINQISEESDRAGAVLKSLFDLNIFINNYVLLGKNNENDLWQTKLSNLKENLDEVYQGSSDNYDLIEKMNNSYRILSNDFSALVKKNNLPIGSAEQIFTESQKMMTQSFYLHDMADNKIEKISQEIYIIIVGFVILMYLFILFLSFLFYSNVIQTIKHFKSVAEYIAQGNFKQRLNFNKKNEIGQMAFAFDEMMSTIEKQQNLLDAQNKILKNNQEEYQSQSEAILNVLEDVEDEKNKLAQEKDKINTILYSIGDAVFVIDKNFKIIMFNEAAVRLSGYSVKEAIGKKYDEVLRFLYEKDRQVNNKFIKDAMQFGKVQTLNNHTLLIRKDSTEIAVADSSAPIKDENGKIIGCVVAFRDVSEERRIDRAKSEFVSLASHQLRTPLTAISWYGEMLLKGEIGKMTDEQKVYLEKIYNSNERMISLVGSLLNVSRIELGTFMIEPGNYDIVAIAQSVGNELKAQIVKKEIKFSFQSDKKIPKKMHIDDKLVRIILQNLLTNAIKYTPDKGKVKMELKKKLKDVEIIISDNGYGIPKRQHDQIYTKLFRADNIKTKETDGTGLGLYIVKSIIDHVGGKIWFKSEENKGTTFHVSLPLSGMREKKGTKRLTWEGY